MENPAWDQNKCSLQDAEPSIQLTMVARSGYRFDSATVCILLFIISLNSASLEKVAGDFCTIEGTRTPGQCKLLSECPSAVEELRTHKIFPKTCGFEGNSPVVCCSTANSFKESTIQNIPTYAEAPLMNKSRQKCKEYSEEYNKNSKSKENGLVGYDLVETKEVCVHFDGFLIQGNKAREREFPHMAAIGYDNERSHKSWLCSGVLISDIFVLTAAHCLTNQVRGEAKYVRVGDLDLNDNDEDAQPQEFNVARIYVHPNFKLPSVYNDVGLIKLYGSVTFTKYARPACLYTESNLPSGNPISMGWGSADYFSEASTHLLKETLQFIPFQKCETSYKNVQSSRKLKYGIQNDTQICAGSFNNRDTCVAGTGALISYNKEGSCMYDVVGIKSFGRACGNPGIPDVFTRVSAYISWIEEIVWPS